MSSHSPDPGGIFKSDYHRRVLAHLGQTAADGYTTEALFERMIPDEGTSIGHVSELIPVLKDLESDGYARNGQQGWYMTRHGFSALTGPNAGDE